MEIKVRIRELQDNIEKQLEDFTRETGIHVEAVEIIKYYYRPLGSIPHETDKEVKYNIHFGLSV